MRSGFTSRRARFAASVTALVGLSVVSGCSSPRSISSGEATARPVAVQQPVVQQPQNGVGSIPLDSSILENVEEVEGDFERIYIPPAPSTAAPSTVVIQ